MTDPECLAAWRRDPDAESLRPVVERYGALVYSSAFRRTGDPQHARKVTRAVFLALARRARKLRKNTVLAGWLFHVTAVASRKLVGQPRRGTGWRWFRPRPRELPPGATWWSRVAPGIDAAMDRLPTRPRNAVLLRLLLNQSLESVIRTLRTSERRATRRVERGLRKLTRRIRQRGDAIDAWISSSRRWV